MCRDESKQDLTRLYFFSYDSREIYKILSKINSAKINFGASK